MSSASFYSALKTSLLSITDLMREEHFCLLPNDWHIVIADICNSTAAVQRGEHNEVNLVAAGCLTAGLNVARAHSVDVPFFFGGDGGTLIVPEEMLSDTLLALRLHGENVHRTFGLSLHLGSVPLHRVYESGRIIKLAKARLGSGFSKAIIIGDGLLWAEQQVKAAAIGEGGDMQSGKTPDMIGLECRWEHIPPPKAAQEIVCYLIQACEPNAQADVYRHVLQETDRIFGKPALRNPLSGDQLKLSLSIKKMRREMLVKFGRWKWRHFAKQMLHTATAQILLKGRKSLGGFNGATYVNEVIANADVLTIDGRINTIIPGIPLQHKTFLGFLNAEELNGTLMYGHYINRESVMTCYIQSRADAHIHFVDGSDGGYTAAADELKRKLHKGGS